MRCALQRAGALVACAPTGIGTLLLGGLTRAIQPPAADGYQGGNGDGDKEHG